MLIRINVGSALEPKEVKVDDSTLLKDVIKDHPNNAQFSINGTPVSSADLNKTLQDLNVSDNAHIIYSSKLAGAKEA